MYHPSKDYRILEHVLTKMPSLSVYMENTFSGQPLVKRISAHWMSKRLSLTKLDIDSNAALKDRWKKFVLTIQAAYAHTMTGHHQDGQVAQPTELHMALKYLCPPMVICYFVEMYPEQASMLMETEKCYPLHYFLSRRDTVRDARSAVRNLISAFPQGVNHPFHSRLPIHLALAAGRKWEDGVQEIVYAGPCHLDSPDPNSGLVPFLQAASSECVDLTTVYHLLRENPAVITTLQ